MGVMICLGQGGLRSPSASSFIIKQQLYALCDVNFIESSSSSSSSPSSSSSSSSCLKVLILHDLHSPQAVLGCFQFSFHRGEFMLKVPAFFMQVCGIVTVRFTVVDGFIEWQLHQILCQLRQFLDCLLVNGRFILHHDNQIQSSSTVVSSRFYLAL